MFLTSSKTGLAVIILIAVVMLLVCAQKVFAWQWDWEPVILKGADLPDFVGSERNQIKAHAFSGTNGWQIVPFQIDNLAFFEDTDKVFDSDDELVFLVRDLGEFSHFSNWILDESSKMHARYQVRIETRAGRNAYLYLFKTNEPTSHSETPSYIHYQPADDRVVSDFFAAGFNTQGLFNFLSIPVMPGATGQDFVDRLKMRLAGSAKIPGFEYLGEIDFKVTEEDLKKQYPTQHLGEKVRIVRRWNFKAEVPINLTGMSFKYPLENQHFDFIFYPAWVEFSARLNVPEGVKIKYFRFSFDLNDKADGARMFCSISDNWSAEFPQGVIIDKQEDVDLNPRTLPAGLNWWMQTGEMGTILALGEIQGLEGVSSQLYYKDAPEGTNDNVDFDDTGDRVSWGDTGIKFTGQIQEVALEVKIFFLPPNLDLAVEQVASDIIHAIQNPLLVEVESQVVPIELASFCAIQLGKKIKLEWQTVSESNNLGFEVQRKTEDENEWQKIGFVQGAGTSSSQQEYSFEDEVMAGTYFYRLKQIDLNGFFAYSEVLAVKTTAPKEFALSQNFPNPFNPVTTIEYALPQLAQVSLVIYNSSGQLVEQIFNGFQEAGEYQITWHGQKNPAGIYFLEMRAGGFQKVIKIILVK